MPHLTVKRLREVLDYDETSGALRWRVTLSRRVVAGKPAGYVNKQSGSLSVDIDGKTYTGQRLAWAYVSGEWPTRRVLPVDGNAANIAKANLFLAPPAGDELTAAALRAALQYDQSSGLFTRKQTRGSAKAGAVAGCLMNKGYFVIRIGTKLHLAHRLAWLYVNEVWPTGQIDHINGNRLDNRIANLRDVTPEVNSQNQRVARSASGLMGAYASKQRGKIRYKSSISVCGRPKALGTFDTPEAAHNAYVAAKRRLHEGCTI